MKVAFSCVHFVAPGTRLVVSGSDAALGSWDLSRALELRPQQRIISSRIPTAFAAIVDLPLPRNGREDAENTILPTNTSTAALSEHPGISYKFVIIEDGAESESSDIAAHRNSYATELTTFDELVTGHSTLLQTDDTDVFHIALPLASAIGCSPNKYLYEGRSSKDNRQLYFNEKESSSDPESLRHLFDDANFSSAVRLINGKTPEHTPEERSQEPMEAGAACVCSPKTKNEMVYLLPVATFKASTSDLDEYGHTTRYYNTIRELNTFHYNKISSHVFCGSCPRQVKHLDHLSRRLGVTAVINLQAECDLQKNFVSNIPDELQSLLSKNADNVPDKSLLHLARIYHAYNRLNSDASDRSWTPEDSCKPRLVLVNIPTTDMCSDARALMLPQTAAIACGLLKNGHKLYIHCNAGVGRAAACTAGIFRYLYRLSAADTQFLLKLRRPVVYYDSEALATGHADFLAKFGDQLYVV